MIEDFFNFIKNPQINTLFYNKPIKKNFVFFIGFIFCLISVFTVGLLKRFFVYFEILETNESIRVDYAITIFNFLIVVIIAPVVEELGFRLILKPINKFYISISFSILSFLSIKFLFNQWLSSNTILIISLFLFILVTYYSQFLLKLVIKYYHFVFYMLAILFSILHIKSLDFAAKNLFSLPILVLPYFFYALSFSYVRMKAGILWSVFLHLSINGLAFFIKYLQWYLTH